MALSLYSPGDLVVQRQHFDKVGRVVEAQGGICQVVAGGQTQTYANEELILISVKNIPNLRLIGQKITDAETALGGKIGLGQEILGYLGSGSVVSRAFADYILKVPPNLLPQCLEALQQTNLPIPDAIDQVLGLNFRLISGAS